MNILENVSESYFFAPAESVRTQKYEIKKKEKFK